MSAILDTPDGDERARQLSEAFQAAGWKPSTENFESRAFVKWQNGWYSAAGFPPNGSCISKSCKTAANVLSMLNATKPAQAPVVATVVRQASADPAAEKTKPDASGWDEPRIKAIEARLDALEARSSQLAERDAEPPPLSPDPVKHMIPEEIRSLMQEGESLSSAKRRLTELLWVEQAELRNLRGTDRENLKREAEIERLLGLFARLGEI